MSKTNETDKIYKCAFFTSCKENTFKCTMCNKELSCTGSGYTNFKAHIIGSNKDKHGNYEELLNKYKQSILDKEKQHSLNSYYGTPTARLYFGWLEYVIGTNQPFNCCDNEIVRKFTRLDAICAKTLITYMEELQIVVQDKIAQLLPNKFGLLLDGWSTGNSNHFIGLFAVFGNMNNERQHLLLRMAQLPELSNQNAQNHRDYIIESLAIYNKNLHNILFLVGDNARVNGAIADLCGKNLIGCASHLLNLELKALFETPAIIIVIEKVSQLMQKLKNNNASGRLKRLTELKPIIKQDTRWSSTYNMLSRYDELSKYLNSRFFEKNLIDEKYFLSNDEEKDAIQLLKYLKEFQDATALLQKNDLTMLEARIILDEVINKCPTMANRLSSDAYILHNSDFTNGIVKVLQGGVITESEQNALIPFLLDNTDNINAVDVTVDDSLAARVAKKAKITISSSKLYMNLEFVPPTSNVVERFFSIAKNVYTDIRRSMSPQHLEAVLFLKMHLDKWNVPEVQTAINNRKKSKKFNNVCDILEYDDDNNIHDADNNVNDDSGITSMLDISNIDTNDISTMDT